jgi:hypothetical protein
VNKPVSIFRTYRVQLNQTNVWDYGLNYLFSCVHLSSSFEFLNRWTISPNIHHHTERSDTRILRGGEAMLIPSFWQGALNIHSDYSKKFYAGINANRLVSQNKNNQNTSFELSATVIPINVLKLSASLNYARNEDNLQYIEAKNFGNSPTKFIMGHLNQKTLGATFRIDYNITPELSIQYYGSPFASIGKYSAFKEVANPKAADYADRFSLLNTTMSENEYHVDAHNGTPEYSVANPDFTFNQFRSNLVFRWEYRPGSQIFLVWGNERTGWENKSSEKVGKTLTRLSKVLPNNIFQIKVNYWFSL